AGSWPPRDDLEPWPDTRNRAGTESGRGAWFRSTPHRFVCRAPDMHVALFVGRREGRAQQHYCIMSRKTDRNSSERRLQWQAQRRRSTPDPVWQRESAVEYLNEL